MMPLFGSSVTLEFIAFLSRVLKIVPMLGLFWTTRNELPMETSFYYSAFLVLLVLAET